MNTWERMVASQEQVILVDEQDREVGNEEKLAAHTRPAKRHRAITVFLFNAAGETLLTQRSASKPLWPGYWDAACSSHPWPGEDTVTATVRRLPFELGVSATDLEDLFAYEYRAVYNERLEEWEVNHIIRGQLASDPEPNPAEVANWRWVAPEEVEQLGYEFGPWFAQAWERILGHLR